MLRKGLGTPGVAGLGSLFSAADRREDRFLIRALALLYSIILSKSHFKQSL